MADRPEAPPEAALIAAATRRSGLSVRQAAKQAGISEGWWRQIVKGYQSLSGGGFGPVRGPAETVARMAQVVGVTAEDLVGAHRPDAAEELRRLPSRADDECQEASRTEYPADPRERIIAAALEGLTPDEQEQVLRNVERHLRLVARRGGRGRAV
ncbi:hypothetical protein ADL21_11405 [Streptomyces albus subsp. albus]|nr:hypothetical protein ADL21_11405 [Streptomyces albus subsp. albus]